MQNNLFCILFRKFKKILNDAISLASKDWFWCFRSAKKKIEIIARTYKSLKKIIDKK